MKCKQCKKGKNLPNEKQLHARCEAKWNSEHIPKNQEMNLSMCPVCKKKFYYYQKAHLHAEQNKHWGDYSV